MLRSAVLLLLSAGLAAEVSQPVTVLRVIDGDSLVVASTVGGLAAGTAVRLQWIDTPEMHEDGGDAARAALLALVPEGSRVQLLVSGDPAALDGHGRVLAVVLDAAGGCVQEQLIAAGHSVYWRRYGEAPEPWHERLQAAHGAARAGTIGLWATAPEWMASRAAERWRSRH